MRIQHNIMAMNAYRNYSNNTSALAKNLEKLSSGYRINRAGDDAAGLAISEKMRAQITALGTAQKNVKDGISLVKTAEGATQEIHDMLNRMVDLAEQSANGTYQNEVDREAIEDEFNALKTEIDRIADASNFNGIKLLDGNMDAGGETTKVSGSFQVVTAELSADDITGAGNLNLPGVGATLGTHTVLHKEPGTAVDTNTFSVELHNLEFSDAKDAKMEIKIGDATFTYTNPGTAGTKMDAAGIAASFKSGTNWVATGTGAAIAADKATIGGVEYDVAVEGTTLKFSTTADLPDGVKIPQTVSIKDPTQATAYQQVGLKVTGAPAKATYTEGVNGAKEPKLELDLAGVSVDKAGKLAISVAGKAYEIEVTQAEITAGNLDQTIAGKLKNAIDANLPAADGNTGTWTATIAGAKITLTGAAQNAAATPLAETFSIAEKAADPASSVTGDYNVSTTNIQTKAAAGDERLASTHFQLDADMIADGSSITIGKKTYTFTTDKNKIGQEGYVDATSGDLATVAKNLTQAVKANNTTYTLGTDATAGHITVTEIKGQTDFDLSGIKGIEESLGFTKSVTSPVNEGKGLTLQIGEDSESYNQLKVSIKDMHVKSLGLDDETLSTQAGAQKAVKAIKDAINQVSTTRGRLGATQNRLEHTANNLSTMKENIQDAEATIRDTDIAEEMMAYTKNNILVQSAQAMLAQANQIPQGVLQLLG